MQGDILSKITLINVKTPTVCVLLKFHSCTRLRNRGINPEKFCRYWNLMFSFSLNYVNNLEPVKLTLSDI